MVILKNSLLLLVMLIVGVFTGLSVSLANDKQPSSISERISSPPTFCDKYLVAVDGVSSFAHFPPIAARYGYKVINVISPGKPLGIHMASYKPELFHQNIPYTGNLQDLVNLLQPFNPTRIVPGAESGVLLADLLSVEFNKLSGVPTNGVLSARRNKYEMLELLRRKGRKVMPQLQSDSYDEILAWIKAQQLWTTGSRQVVLKPLDSGGTDGVHFCKNEEDLKKAFADLINKINDYGNVNKKILIQPFLDGIEHVVDSFTLNYKTYYTDIWRYNKRFVEGACEIYGNDRLIRFEGPLQDEIVAFHEQTLNDFEYKDGWAHGEYRGVMARDKDGNPLGYNVPGSNTLIEMGFRMMGAGQPRIAAEAIGEAQLEVGAEGFFEPEKFMKRGRGFKFRDEASVVSLRAADEGKKFSSKKALPIILNLPGYVHHSFGYKEGDLMSKTIDMKTQLGQVELVHKNADVLEKSIETLYKLEEQGAFYE